MAKSSDHHDKAYNAFMAACSADNLLLFCKRALKEIEFHYFNDDEMSKLNFVFKEISLKLKDIDRSLKRGKLQIEIEKEKKNEKLKQKQVIHD
jgi:hypothetical protein